MQVSAIVFACLSDACAPPPAGTGGSLPAGSVSTPSPSKVGARKFGNLLRKEGYDAVSVTKNGPKSWKVRTSSGKTVVLSTGTDPSKRLTRSKPAVSESPVKSVKSVKSAAKDVPTPKPTKSAKGDTYKRLTGEALAEMKKNPKLANAVGRYGAYAFEAMNASLRNKYPVDNVVLRSSQVKSLDELKEMVDAMKDGFKTSPGLSEDVQVFRAIDLPLKLKKGATISDKGFLSTSTSEDMARKISVLSMGMSEHTVFRITAKKGTKFLPGNQAETELIFPPGSKLKVTGVSTERQSVPSNAEHDLPTELTYTIYDVELV